MSKKRDAQNQNLLYTISDHSINSRNLPKWWIMDLAHSTCIHKFDIC